MDLSQRRLDESLEKVRVIIKNISWMTRGEVTNLEDGRCQYQRVADDAEAMRELFRPSYPDSTSMLVHALGRFRDMACQDPRDRLYAFISLDQSFKIVPNYNFTVEEVYLQFAQALIDRGMFMDIFHNFRQHFGVPEESQLDLPSWVPDLRLPFTSIPRRTFKIPRELWAHRDASLSCSLYYIGAVVDVGMATESTFNIHLQPMSVKYESTVDVQGRPKPWSIKKFHGHIGDLVIGKPQRLAIQEGDYLFSPILMEFPSDKWETTRIMFLRSAGYTLPTIAHYFGDMKAYRVVGTLPAHALKLIDEHDEDVLMCRERTVRLV